MLTNINEFKSEAHKFWWNRLGQSTKIDICRRSSSKVSGLSGCGLSDFNPDKLSDHTIKALYNLNH